MYNVKIDGIGNIDTVNKYDPPNLEGRSTRCFQTGKRLCL